jgi:hypothetical protein
VSETKQNNTFKIAIAVCIAAVSVVGGIGGGRAGLMDSEDNRLTRAGLLNKTRQEQINLANQLTALDQALYAQQYQEQLKLAASTEADAIEIRQQGRTNEARVLEEQADAHRALAAHLRNFFYADYAVAGGGFDEARFIDDLTLSYGAREYRGLDPDGYIQRGDAQGDVGIRSVLALAVSGIALVLFGLADMTSRKIKYLLAALGVAVLLLSAWMLINA